MTSRAGLLAIARCSDRCFLSFAIWINSSINTLGLLLLCFAFPTTASQQGQIGQSKIGVIAINKINSERDFPLGQRPSNSSAPHDLALYHHLTSLQAGHRS